MLMSKGLMHLPMRVSAAAWEWGSGVTVVIGEPHGCLIGERHGPLIGEAPVVGVASLPKDMDDRTATREAETMRRPTTMAAQGLRRLNVKRPIAALVAAVLIAFGAGWAISGVATGTTEPVVHEETTQPVEQPEATHDDGKAAHDDGEAAHDDAKPEAAAPPVHGDDDHDHATDHD